jgi:NAD(P)-dependent dehydrogenase (short-subunit alcohol dehydrogenase family)
VETYGSARVVVVASEAYKFVSGIDFEAIRKPVVPGLQGLVGCMKRYGQSKLANIMFAQELDRRLKAKGQEKVFVAAINPGQCILPLGKALEDDSIADNH